MKSSLVIYFLLISSFISFGQMDSSKIFGSSKGHWPLPLPRYLEIYNNENLKHFMADQFDSTLRIVTDSAYQVTAVHDGTIGAIIEVDGEYTVLSSFGKYFIAYRNLNKPDLEKGEFIKTGQPLGHLVKNWTEDNYTLEIILFKGDKQLSAERWIAW